MRSKAPLVLMEQMVMILVFALAAALCLQAFAESGEKSRAVEARDHAVTLCQSAAEALRSAAGDLSLARERLGGGSGTEDALLAVYDEDWNEAAASGKAVRYELRAQRVDSGVDGLGKASVSVSRVGGDPLFQLEVAWQEEVPAHG